MTDLVSKTTAIRDRLARATQGPLVVEEHNGRFDVTNGKWGQYGSADQRLFHAEGMSEGDAQLFAHAPTDLTRLLAALEVADAALESIWFGDNPKTERVDLDFGAVRSLYTAKELSELAKEARAEILRVMTEGAE